MQDWGKVLWQAVYALNQCPMYDTISPIVRIHKCGEKEMEMSMAALTVTASDY